MRVLELAGVVYIIVGLVLTTRLLIQEYGIFREDFAELTFPELAISLLMTSLLQTFGWGVFLAQSAYPHLKRLRRKIYDYIKRGYSGF